jgi:hypothetical protein
MQFLNMLLATTESLTTDQKIDEIYDRIGTQPEWAFELMWVLPVLIAVGVLYVFKRQRTIAKNQVDLARLVEQIGER